VSDKVQPALTPEGCFTWEDVTMLRAIAANTLDRDPALPFANPIVAERFYDLADRIAALLPPREDE
jgi:hypothetical protein